MEEKRQPKPGKKRLIQIILICVLAVVLFVILRYVYIMFVNPMSAFSQTSAVTLTPAPTPVLTPAPTPDVSADAAVAVTPEPTPVPTPTPTPVPVDAEFMKNRVNILLIGWDQSPERDVEGTSIYRDDENNFRSDAMMLLTVDFSGKTAHLISIPRDTMARIYTETGEFFSETGRWKINAAFAKGGGADSLGFQYAIKTIEAVLQVPIGYYAGVDMAGIKVVVDAMGGVDFDVDIETTLNGRPIVKGFQHLNGQQVLDYCRARKGISTDTGRNDRQQRILFAIFEQLRTRGQLKNLPNIFLSLIDYVHTNLTVEQIAALTAFGLDIDMDDLYRHTIEGEYFSNTPYNNASFYVYYNDKLIELMNGIFGVTIMPDPQFDAEYVRADVAAKAASKYVDGANYLLTLPVVQSASMGALFYDQYGTLVSAPPWYLSVVNARDAVNAAVIRPCDVETVLPDGTVVPAPSPTPVPVLTETGETVFMDPHDIPLDMTAITEAQNALYQAMYSLCYTFGITPSSVDTSMLPKAFVKVMPQAAALPGATVPGATVPGAAVPTVPVEPTPPADAIPDADIEP